MFLTERKKGEQARTELEHDHAKKTEISNAHVTGGHASSSSSKGGREKAIPEWAIIKCEMRTIGQTARRRRKEHITGTGRFNFWITGFSSEIGTKLRESAVGQAGGNCYSRAALSSNDSKTRYNRNLKCRDFCSISE